MKMVPIGARGEAEENVEFKHTLTANHAQLPPVYSTPDMIRLMETAAFHALQPFCEDDEITVGTAIHIEHRTASAVGARIHAEAVVESFDGRFYTVRVSAQDGAIEIGRGTVGRAVVSVRKFLDRLNKAPLVTKSTGNEAPSGAITTKASKKDPTIDSDHPQESE
jgi:fluoroacetyl-CoA thioesterase